MFWVVFRSFAKKKEMVRGDKKSNRTTNLDFPSVLLNQGLTEANNNTREETSFAFFPVIAKLQLFTKKSCILRILVFETLKLGLLGFRKP